MGQEYPEGLNVEDSGFYAFLDMAQAISSGWKQRFILGIGQ